MKNHHALIILKQGSPQTTAFSMSDLSNDNVTSLDFLGFKLDNFVKQVRMDPNGNHTSGLFPHPTADEVNELNQYAAAKGYKVRLKYDPRGSYVQIPYIVHERPAALITQIIGANNSARTHRPHKPIACDGTGDTPVGDGTNQPDLRTTVIGRNSHGPLVSPNLMVETRFRNGETDAQFHHRLLSFFGEADVMLVIGISISNRDPHGRFVALCVVYGRGNHNLPEVLCNVSFGTAEVEVGDIWDEVMQTLLHPLNPAAIVPALVGVGVGGPACTEATGGADPYLIVLPQELMLCINSTLPYAFHATPGYGVMAAHPYEINLFYMQETIDDSLPAYVALIP